MPRMGHWSNIWINYIKSEVRDKQRYTRYGGLKQWIEKQQPEKLWVLWKKDIMFSMEKR